MTSYPLIKISSCVTICHKRLGLKVSPHGSAGKAAICPFLGALAPIQRVRPSFFYSSSSFFHEMRDGSLLRKITSLIRKNYEHPWTVETNGLEGCPQPPPQQEGEAWEEGS